MSIAQHYFYATMTFFCFYILSHSSMTSKYVVPMMRRKITSPPCLTFCLTEVYFLSFRGSTLPILERLFYTQIAMSKIIYVIPGYPHTTSMDMYKPLLALLKEQQFNIVPVSITWKYRVMSDYCKEFLKQYTKHTKTDEVYILWFSFGAMIAFITSPETNPKALFLCSLSPFFQEDLPGIKERWKKSLGFRRTSDFDATSFDLIAKRVKCKTHIFAGTQEWPEVEKRAKAAKQKIYKSELHMIGGARHDIGQGAYVKKVGEVLGK